jgi:hypothetical protein
MSTVSPFRSALGARFETLAPVLRRHYNLGQGQAITIEGRMDAWNRYPLLRVVIPFMPIPAQDVRVVVDNLGVLDNGELCFEWRRAFHNPGGVALSHTLTRPLPAAADGVPRVMDVFGGAPGVGVTLALSVLEDGALLQQVTHGPQYALIGARRLRLPGFAQVRSVATERAIDAQTIETRVVISHPLLGRMFGYHGTLRVR